MDSQLAQLEIKHKITRWKQSNPDYVSAKIEESMKLIYASLRVAIVKRQFLLKLKAKYAGTPLYWQLNSFTHYFVSIYIDGQKIAKKLSNGIDKETSRAGQLLDDYNAGSSEVEPYFSPLLFSDVLSPDSNL